LNEKGYRYYFDQFLHAPASRLNEKAMVYSSEMEKIKRDTDWGELSVANDFNRRLKLEA
jgi:hypothetical protein